MSTPEVPPLSHLAPPAVVDGDVRLGRDEVSACAEALAAGLHATGVRPGDVVAFQLPNWWEAVVVYHACWRRGAVAFPLHHRLTGPARADLLARTSPSATFIAGHLEPPAGAVAVRGDNDEFGRLLHASTEAPTATVRPGDVAVLLATSGSTGRPKLVRHTHAGLHGKARTMVIAHGLTSVDVVLMPAPLAHVSGLLNGVLIPGCAGMSSVLLDRWDASTALAIIAREHVSFMIGPPTFFLDLAAAPGFTPDAVDSMRLISCGGATVTEAFVTDTAKRFGAVVKRTYGSTEAPTVTTSHVGDPPDLAATTDGRPTRGVDLSIRDPATGCRLPDGIVGELWVRGPEVFVGYDDPAATAESFDDDGFFRTGDLARVDAAGWLTVVGRASATIIRGGENISPGAVEDACHGLDGVRQLAVVGRPDERLGERVALVVEADRAPTLDAVRERCAAAGLPRFSWPEHVVAVPELPRLPAGKLDRRAIGLLARDGQD